MSGNLNVKKKKVIVEGVTVEKSTIEEKEQAQILENIQIIEKLIEELDKLKFKKGFDIRICPKCFSVKIKEEDYLTKSGANNAYATCYCQGCGRRSNKWLFLERNLSEEEREEFIKKLGQEFPEDEL